MTREEAISELKTRYLTMSQCLDKEDLHKANEAIDMAIKALKQQPCEDAISRQAVLDIDFKRIILTTAKPAEMIEQKVKALSPITPQPKMGHCKDCEYFEYDSVANVDGIPLIVAHEICKRWGDGCKTKENGYCFLFKPRESEE